MNTILLIFFAIPIAVIIISIALQKILKCPILVSAIIFAIFFVITFVIGNLIFLVATIVYTIIAFITAIITKLICGFLREFGEQNCRREKCESSNINNRRTQLLSTTSGCCRRR